ncbi:scavenger receptor cysteine-rich domain-containing protein DMBT1-like [Amphiura filiformis]|uniref:scavenger receptor cysteine-rich domain-containing protein DMBT1-like n=1 Tax=Amphiura filiformis TaxID=82378 RepID=UPI003B221491
MGYVTMEHLEGILRESWAHVCYEDDGHTWSDVEAAVVCMYLGFENGTAVAFDEWDSNGYILDNFVCPVDSVSLTDCNWDSVIHSVDGCGSRRYAGVKCFNSPCGGNFTSPSGFLYSPGYPDLYPNSANCTYFVNVTGATRLVFTFHVFQLEYNHDRVQYTQYQPTDIDSVNHGTLTGLGQQAPLEFYSNTLWMRFTTDSSVEYPGFNISWKASYTECKQHFTSMEGNFSSPYYPNNYPNLANCVYLFSIANRYRFPVLWERNRCSIDVLIEGGQHLTGSNVWSSLVINSGYAWFVFTSDITISERGFYISWQARTETLEGTPCGQNFTSRSGVIRSPNYPGRHPSDADCVYVISVPSADRIAISFLSFDLEVGYDFLYYGIGTQPTTEGEVSLTGSFTPDAIELVTNSLWFHFTSDGSVNNYGFQFTWTAINSADCHGYYNLPVGNITSPNYPRPYPGFSNCSYIINVASASHITIILHDFALEFGNDLLYFGIGEQPRVDAAIGSFTGYFAPSAFSLRTSSLWFIFQTNGAGSDLGFALTWDTTKGSFAT